MEARGSASELASNKVYFFSWLAQGLWPDKQYIHLGLRQLYVFNSTVHSQRIHNEIIASTNGPYPPLWMTRGPWKGHTFGSHELVVHCAFNVR